MAEKAIVRHAVVIDLGGTKISWAIINDSFEIGPQGQTPTPGSPEEILSSLEELIGGAIDTAADTVGIGIAVAGMVDFSQGLITATPNLPLAGAPVKERLESKFRLKCLLDNDANLAVLGEYFCGAGRGRRDFIGLTVGTGIGGGIIVDGRVCRGVNGAAAEFGHMVIVPGGPMCGCGNLGCFEALASGTALERMAKEAVAGRPDSSLGRRVRGRPELINGRLVAEAAAAGDLEALGLLRDIGGWLGVGIGNLINVLNPEAVVIGGGVASSLEMVLDTIADKVAAVAIDPRAKKTPLLLSELENRAGLLGAAGLVFSAG